MRPAFVVVFNGAGNFDQGDVVRVGDRRDTTLVTEETINFWLGNGAIREASAEEAKQKRVDVSGEIAPSTAKCDFVPGIGHRDRQFPKPTPAPTGSLLAGTNGRTQPVRVDTAPREVIRIVRTHTPGGETIETVEVE